MQAITLGRFAESFGCSVIGNSGAAVEEPHAVFMDVLRALANVHALK